MKIDEIIIRNYGIYQDPKPIDLRTTQKRPIILFGGLNGGGKTTLLDAILLCLYGPLAKTSNRGSKGYHAYLKDSLNRHTQDDEAYIELTFRHYRDGREDQFKVRRQWRVRSTVQETLNVEVNGSPDALLQEDWLNFIDELIPAQIANLFFFDGEKIEQFADLENAQHLLEAALHSLLGLDVLNQLGTDLKTLGQRKKIALKSSHEQQELFTQQDALNEITVEIQKTKKQLGGARTDLDRVKANLNRERARYSRKGGALYDQRSILHSEKTKLKQDLQFAKAAFVHAAATETPLIWVKNLLEQVCSQADIEASAQQAKIISSIMVERDNKTLNTIERIAGKEAKETLAKQLEREQRQYQKKADAEQYLNLTSDGLRQVHKAQGVLPTVTQHFNRISKTIASIEEAVERVDKKIQSVPDPETIKQLRGKVERWEKEEQKLVARMALLEEELRLLNNKADMLQASIFNKLESDLNTKFHREDDQRVINYADKATETLESLKRQVIDQRIGEIESLILGSFKQLIRKPKLIGKIQISTQNYALSLFDHRDVEIHPSRLSAGERQLLAISILWGLAKAAGLPLPVVIDTPLGRLDGEHRNKLLKAYFPKASHQVLILSTDTEIAKHYYAQLEPSIQRSYRIEYNAEKQASEINDGYQFS